MDEPLDVRVGEVTRIRQGPAEKLRVDPDVERVAIRATLVRRIAAIALLLLAAQKRKDLLPERLDVGDGEEAPKDDEPVQAELAQPSVFEDRIDRHLPLPRGRRFYGVPTGITTSDGSGQRLYAEAIVKP